jgi:hypothetical protein
MLGPPLWRVLPVVVGLALVGSGCGGSSSTGSSARRGASHGVVAEAAGLPTPQSYAETCRLVGSWCAPTAGRIPRALRRPLHLPRVGPDWSCPTSSGHRIDNGQFGGIALGPGPVEPLIAMAGDLERGVIAFSRRHGWWSAKTLWFSHPRYQGPVLIRGRRLDGRGRIVFGEDPSLIDPQLPPKPTINGTNGWREWPGGTFIRSLGCYGWQVDGSDFSHVVVFRAIRRKG